MSETVGEQLREARLRRKIPLEQAAQATHIRLHYLEAIEAGDIKTLPSPAQARGFIRAYADYLDLNAVELLAAFQAESDQSNGRKKEEASLLAENSERISSHADSLFQEVGQKLARQRNLLGLSLEDVERHTHLRAHYLQALEKGDLRNLPSPVQARGMLKNYASFLGLETDDILLRFAEGLQAHLYARQAADRVGRPATSRKRRVPDFLGLIPFDYIISGLIVLALVGFVVWGGLRISALRKQSPSQTPLYTAPSIVEFLSATGTPLAALTPATESLTTPGTADSTSVPGVSTTNTPEIPPLTSLAPTLLAPPPAGNAVLQVYVIVHQRAWMRVIVDGKVEFEGRVLHGSAYPFSGDKRIEVLTGNAAALQIFFNQVDLGIMGVEAEVEYLVFTPQGVLTPTATITFTPLPTATSAPQSTATK